MRPDVPSPAFAGEVARRRRDGGVLHRRAEAPPPLFERSPSPANAALDVAPIQPFPSCSPRIRATAAGRDSCWRRLRCRQAAAVGAGAHGDPGERASPSAGLPASRPHPCRGARRARRAVGDGGGAKMLRLSAVIGEFWGDPRALDFTATRRLAVASERSGVAAFLIRLGGHANLSGARMRWRIASAPSLAQRARPARAGAAGMECRAVPRARSAAGAMEHRA